MCVMQIARKLISPLDSQPLVLHTFAADSVVIFSKPLQSPANYCPIEGMGYSTILTDHK